MEITKEFLMQRMEGLKHQHDDLLKRSFLVDGAIQDCQQMLEMLEEEEKKETEAASVEG